MTRLPPPPVARAATAVRTALQRVGGRMAPAEVGVLELASGFMATHALYAAVRLRIPDALADGPLPPAEVAERAGCDSDATHRLLRACASWGAFRELPDGRFALTPLADRLRSGTESSMRDVVLMLGNPSYQRVWSELPETVRTGELGAERALGLPMWDFVEQDPEFGTAFDDAMSRLASLDWPTVEAVYDFARFRRIVDLGGGHGQLLALMLAAAPAAEGVLLELEAKRAGAQRLFERSGIQGRSRFEAGSFFDTAPADGDLYVLRRVLHDFDDHDATRILSTVRRHMPAGATLLVLESVVPTGNTPHFAKALDLDLMLFVGGRERTGEEWRSLLGGAGFGSVQIVPTISMISLIEAAPEGPSNGR